ncbi:MAG: hypothetical protein HYZ25_02035 [Chloroflexi bacterium]|nr:hypothetical protein [Chloroflexota bacterium]
MNQQTVQTALKLFLLTIFALTSSCAPLTAVPSPTATPAPSQTPTATVTPSPTNTPEPVYPKGTLVYLTSGKITTLNLQSQEAKTIFTTHALNSTFVVGNSIYIASFTNYPTHHSEMIKTNLDGTNIEQLLPSNNKYWSLDCGGMLRPNSGMLSPNKKFLLCYYGDNNAGSILVIDTETKSIRPIQAQDNHSFQTISWSSNSQKVYLLDTVKVLEVMGVPVVGIHDKGRLLEFSLETNKLSELLPEISNPDVRWSDQDQIAGWSPNGINLLINLACDSKSVDIIDHPYIFNTDDKTTTPIKVDGCISRFEWSPDSTKIALTIFDKNAHSDLFIYDIASQNLLKIPVNGQQVFSFAWSPNQKYILFSIWTFQDNRNGVYLLNVSDGSAVQVMPNAKYSYSYQANDFIWSPTGDMVLFMQGKQELDGQELYLLNADTKSITLVERQFMGAWYFHQMWSPDGNYFIFVGGGPTRIFKIQNAYSGEQIEVKVPDEIDAFAPDIYWIINNSVYSSGGPN